MSLDEKTKSSLKLLKDKILISKRMTRALTLITNNLLTTTFLTMKPVILKFRIPIQSSNLKIGRFQNSVNFFKIKFTELL